MLEVSAPGGALFYCVRAVRRGWQLLFIPKCAISCISGILKSILSPYQCAFYEKIYVISAKITALPCFFAFFQAQMPEKYT
jgi:hypothetical protein